MSAAGEWIVYILRCADETLYTGITNDFPKRLAQHEKGIGAKYTKGRGPFEVVFSEQCPDKSAALKRELEIKVMKREEKFFLAKGWLKE